MCSALIFPFGFNAMGRKLLPSNEISQLYNGVKSYSADDLELMVNDNGTHFTLWSPKADSVKVNLYEKGIGGTAFKVLDMTEDNNNGVWRTSVQDKLYGKFYTFSVKFKGIWLKETPGVWAKSVGVNGNRAAIIDLAETNPDGWSDDKSPILLSPTDAIVYEMHHRDFSIHPSSGIENKGKFIALLESGTTSLEGEKTGIDHLKELGITHVQILPSYDYGSIDETILDENRYNWGYDPKNYNTPDGSYSTNPYAPEARIKEMKEMIQALHTAGIAVIMDVVYNHTYSSTESNFSLTAPYYYYRYTEDGRFSNASGCGNETASEREQMQQFIINSVKYWVEEYHIDGFRFDLMAIHDTETMNMVATELKAINPNIIIYGEGWTAGDSPLPVESRALKIYVDNMKGVGVFSDDIRDGIKGHYSDTKERGFATGKSGLEETVKLGIIAATPHPQIDYSKGGNASAPYASDAAQVVNYVSCHDDLTLTDKLKASMPNESEINLLRMAKLSQTIVLTSQGIPFIFAGEEIFRDKKGVHNSYKSPDSINAIDWSLKHKYRDQFDYYRELIQLRKAHPAFRMRTAYEIAQHIEFDEIDEPNLISYSIKGNANGDKWNEIKLIFNGSAEGKNINIKEADWKIVAIDGKISSSSYLGATEGG